MKREIPGIDALAKAFPEEWLLYASLNCYPRAQPPMEIDALVVMEERVLLLEIKDWNGKLTQRNDQWFIGGQSRGRSPVVLAEEKAKKLSTVLKHEIPQLKNLWVDGRVILTGASTKEHISENEKRFVWTLNDACSIVDPEKRFKLLPQTRLGLLKAYQFEADFDRVTNNAKIFQALEADWAGYRVCEADVVTHPRSVWREHLAERNSESRIKALLRVWSFDRLPPGLNSPDRRRLIAEREVKAFAHLSAIGSVLIERNVVFQDIAPAPSEILTNHFDLRSLPRDWTTLDRFLEKAQEELDASDRVLLATTVLSCLAELHKSRIAHRDLGPRAVWVGSSSKLAINGLMCCQLPDEESIEDWLAELKGYAPSIPEDVDKSSKGTATQRDVYLAGILIGMVLGLEFRRTSEGAMPDAFGEFECLRTWFNKALQLRPERRFADAMQMSDEFAALVETFGAAIIDQSLLDRHETTCIPFVEWVPKTFITQDSRRSVYKSATRDGQDVIVKVWHGMRRNVNAASDLALLRLLDGAARLLITPVLGLPQFIALGLSPVGPYVVYACQSGRPVNEIGPVSASDALWIASRLLSTIGELHDLGCDHGDIAPKNVLVDLESRDVCLIDAFDIAPVGDGVIRTPSLCPHNWEKLSQPCVDRYAALKVVETMFLECGDPALAQVLNVLREELDRPIIESLEVALAAIRQASESREKPLVPTFELTSPEAQDSFFKPDGDGYFLTRHVGANQTVQYVLTGIDHELLLVAKGGVLTTAYFQRAQFWALSYASRNGIKVAVSVHVSPGQQHGFSELFAYVAEAAAQLPQALVPESPRATDFDVPRYWDRLLELEANDRASVEIGEELAFREGVAIYALELPGRVFDFDPESIVDVYLPGNKRVGELDHAFSDLTTTLAVRNPTRRLSEGDSVYLVDRREQTSIDRRTKAVRKILDRQAAIPNLIEYFSSGTPVQPKNYGVTVDEEALKTYGLNPGQETAFRKLLELGPVGLLQGPPGTGKTRFIASFVHWLISKGGARRVLIASQSHEAVNNAIEALIDLYKKFGGKPNLLRIGSKGITQKIRPYHSAELRERYRTRFEAAIKHRVAVLAVAKGVSRAFASAALELDSKIGEPARAVRRLRLLAEESTDAAVADRERYTTELRRAERAFEAAGKAAGIQIDVARPSEALDIALSALLSKFPQSSPSDIAVMKKVIELSADWLNSMASVYRNFDEFLAKTRGIITATCVGVGETKIRIDASHFDWVIVDEAARCTSSELAVPVQMGRRVLLVGDHLQLMPMIERKLVDELQEEFPEVGRDDLMRSDFERAFLSSYGNAIGSTLTHQYRMHPAICDLVSSCFYEPNAVMLSTAPDRTPAVTIPTNTVRVLQKPICWIDTGGLVNETEQQLPNSTTFHNDAEIEAVIRLLDVIAASAGLVENLIASGEETPIGVICMYSGQVRRLELACARHAWSPRFRRLVRIDTVDGYQGKENAIVIVSLVRSNPARAPGHVRNSNRCNVALSRAKERLFVVGSRRMWSEVNADSPMHRTLQYICEHADAAQVLQAEVLG